ncbi:alpha/beta hydrolase family protein [Streptomyces purpurascens]|uniref:alpha/beta hydrolase family protein n=1 Tax=Streptomyces purpurascens TaxID=1924 RepID=UPI001673D650|nr:hypothetical protein [Streptomyces purpurascens]MCE7050135.1 hypothetical protein [Streptomyces purpurascens]GHA25501.1 hypothetical protein GCM10010303_40050 [Streptomyces purpurascens]
MIHARRTVVAAAAVFAVVVGSPGLAHAQPAADPTPSTPSAGPGPAPVGGLPAGWQITGKSAGQQLTWRSNRPVPMGDAAVEFYSGDRPLGRPVAGKDGHTFRLDLEGVTLGAAKDLQVRAAGRRLDEAGVKADSKRRSAMKPVKPVKPVEPSALPPANPVDPGVPGPYRTVSGEYTLKSVQLPDFPAPVEMRATVTAPTGAQGKRPLALFLHGRHSTCFTGGADGEALGEWPCPTGSKPIPSYRGYLHDQKLLASQGYVTVSISANGVNGQDYAAQDAGAQARSSLVRQHLARWADWSGTGRTKAPAIVRKAARADLSRVLLVGHSRGGEGVNRAAMDSLSKPPADKDGYRGPVRWKIRGTVLIGPTVFGQNPAPDVPSMTILPGCDGDVSDLQGEIYVDGTRGVSRGAALHSAVYMVGANHNYFNTEWTPGQAEAPADDDFWNDGESPDPVCTPGTATRLTAERQQAAGSTYTAAAARLFVAGDDRVRPLLDGSNVRAASAGPARILTHAVGARRTAAFLPDAPVTVDGGRLCAQVDPDPATACLNPENPGGSPHFAGWETEREPGRNAVALDWSTPGSAVRVRPGRPVSLSGAKSLALRVIVPPNTTGTRLDVSLTDTAGRHATLGAVRLDGLPGSDRTASYWGQEVRVPLTAATAAGLDLKRVKSLVLTPRSGSGQAWLMDAWGWRPGMAAVRQVALPRVDIGLLTAEEGDSGVRTYKVPVRLSGQRSGQFRLFVADPETGEVTSRLVTVRPGSGSVDVPVEVRGNTRFSYGTAHHVFAKAVRGTVVGNHLGGLSVKDDDPMPTFSATPLAGRVTEGQSLKWRIDQSAVADTEIWLEAAFARVDGGAELSSTDVDPRWFEANTGESPSPARPLSEVEGFYLGLAIPAGELSTEVTVPTAVDGASEPEESLRIRMSIWTEDRGQVEGPVLDGTVVDAP